MAWLQSDERERPHFQVSLPNTPAGARHARKQLISFARHMHLDLQTILDVEIAVGEALANAAEHGRRPGGTIRLEAWLTNSGLEAAISDDGPGFVANAVSRKDLEALAPRGYGLFLMQALMDEVEFRNDGKTVWFLKRL